jgi:ATP-dependent DNA helicase RecG
MSRPRRLFPLFAGLETLPGVGPKAAQAFESLGVDRPRICLFTCCRIPASTAARVPRSAMWCRPPP